MKDQLSEEDIQVLFSPEKPQAPVKEEKIFQPPKINRRTVIYFGMVFLTIFLLSYSLINWPALAKKFQWTWDVQLKRQTYSAALPVPTPNILNPTSEAHLIIPKIGTDVSIIWNIPEKDLKDKLLEGVVHSQGTALPGQEGNIFITGHSSYYSWVDSPYKEVFVLLDQLSVGDKIYIQYSKTILTYQVVEIKVVSSKEVSVMAPVPGYNLTLMTCVPVGTNLRRLIVRATQV